MDASPKAAIQVCYLGVWFTGARRPYYECRIFQDSSDTTREFHYPPFNREVNEITVSQAGDRLKRFLDGLAVALEKFHPAFNVADSKGDCTRKRWLLEHWGEESFVFF